MGGQKPSCDYLNYIIDVIITPLSLCIPPAYQFVCIIISKHYILAVTEFTNAKLCGVEQRAPPMFGRATIRLGIGPHSSILTFHTKCQRLVTIAAKFRLVGLDHVGLDMLIV